MSEGHRELLQEFSVPVLRRAHQLLDAPGDLQVREDAQHEGVWWVTSLRDSSVTYRVQVIDSPHLWVICGCGHGSHRGGDARCYHAAAVLALIAYGPARAAESVLH